MMLLAMALAAVSPPGNFQFGGGRAWYDAASVSRCVREAVICADLALREGTPAQAVAYLQAGAKAGDPLAMRSLGLMLVRGEHVRRDQPTALGWFYEAALRGDAESMLILATAFDRGIGTKADPRLARYWRARADARR